MGLQPNLPMNAETNVFWYLLLADVIVVVHFAYVAFVVAGFVAILLGMFLRWQWIRNPWFRWIHLAMIGVVALESIADFRCPLTDWEADLYKLAGRTVEEGSFVGRLLNQILFINLEVDHPAFKWAYISAAALIVATFIFAPPRSFRRRRVDSEPA